MKNRNGVRNSLRVFVLLLALVSTVGAPAVWAVNYLDDTFYEENKESQVADPIEPVNRAFFIFNDRLHTWVIHPVATGYSNVVPWDIRSCIGNFFYNLVEPVRSVNCLLQGRVADSGKVLSRFALNTVCGVFGLADAAGESFKIDRINASFGETLEVWWLGDGFYLVVPILGPSTLRDFSGTMVDSVAASTYSPWNDDALTTATVQGGKTVNWTSLHLGDYEEVKSLSFDPYVAIRNGYFQRRNKLRDPATLMKK